MSDHPSAEFMIYAAPDFRQVPADAVFGKSTAVADLAAKVDALTAQVTDLQTQLTALDARVAALEAAAP